MAKIDPKLAPYLAKISKLGAELDKRRRESMILTPYDEGDCPIPYAIGSANLTKAYRMLMPMSDAPWGSLVVGSSLDRLDVSGVQDKDNQAAVDAAWGAWQDNAMDDESKLAHHSALVTGRAFALVWWGDDGKPEISLDNSEQMIVQYKEGSRRKRVAALRRWWDDDAQRAMATLYLPDGVYKFQGPANADGAVSTNWERDTEWEVRQDPEDSTWPVSNPLGVVPVVELAVNRRLKPGAFGFARGEFAHCTGLIDRINLLTFLGLVVAFWMGFPLRGVIGERVLRDDNDEVIPPFDVYADGLFQLEDPNAKIAEYKAADRKNLSVYAELDQFATITRTPRHYFPLEGGMSQIAADTIRANEGALHAKISGDYKPSLGEGWEEVLRLCTRILGGPVLSPRAELQWRDHESRSLGERVDAYSKLVGSQLPFAAAAELALDVSQDQIRRWSTDASSSVIGQLLADAQTNGNGAAVPVA